ncbi:hypothetical protein QTP70_034567, partial [Hemibagrus guttatus]
RFLHLLLLSITPTSNQWHISSRISIQMLTSYFSLDGISSEYIRFRKESVAIPADIQQMFYCFLVKEQDRNFLRFLWFGDNDLSKDIVEYRMKVHVFGNSPSPTVAIYGLRKAAHLQGKEQDSEVQQFIEYDFYVDNGLKSLPTVEAAVSVLKRTQNILAISK